MLIGCMNVYQDGALLGVSLPALLARVDRVVVVDGAYRDFQTYGESPSSNDGTQNLARHFGAEVIEARPGLDEIAKRSRYFVGKPGDWYLVVDADEVIEGMGRDAVKSALNASPDDDYQIPFCQAEAPWEAKHRGVFRLHRHRDGMRYHGTHHALHVPGQDGQLVMTVKPGTAPKFDGLLLRHLQMARSADRQNRKAAYYQKLGVTEREFRAAHGL